MEVLAASDNVLRGGFTRKRVDVDELLRVLTFTVLVDPVVKPVALSDALVTWPVPVDDFALMRATIGRADENVTIDAYGPRIVFCQRGSVVLDDGTPLELRSGQAAYGDADRPMTVRGEGVVFVASSGHHYGP
jgi:mannose-6-phosphate isomerase